MEKTSNTFWDIASWLAIPLLGLISTYYYFSDYHDFSEYFWAVHLTIILVIARAFDCTTKNLQIFFVITTILLIVVITQLGWGDYRAVNALMVMVLLSAFCSGLFFGAAVASKDLYHSENKKQLSQYRLSIAAKCAIWIPSLIPYQELKSPHISDFFLVLVFFFVAFLSYFLFPGS